MLQADPRSLATTCGISVDFFSSGYLDVSVHRVRSTQAMYSLGSSLAGGFPHSDIYGSKLYCQLPVAFRRLTRLSSPVIAKASIICTYSLDPIILSPLAKTQHYKYFFVSRLWHRIHTTSMNTALIQSKTHLVFHTFTAIVLPITASAWITSLLLQIVKELLITFISKSQYRSLKA